MTASHLSLSLHGSALSPPIAAARSSQSGHRSAEQRRLQRPSSPSAATPLLVAPCPVLLPRHALVILHPPALYQSPASALPAHLIHSSPLTQPLLCSLALSLARLAYLLLLVLVFVLAAALASRSSAASTFLLTSPPSSPAPCPSSTSASPACSASRLQLSRQSVVSSPPPVSASMSGVKSRGVAGAGAGADTGRLVKPLPRSAWRLHSGEHRLQLSLSRCSQAGSAAGSGTVTVERVQLSLAVQRRVDDFPIRRPASAADVKRQRQRPQPGQLQQHSQGPAAGGAHGLLQGGSAGSGAALAQQPQQQELATAAAVLVCGAVAVSEEPVLGALQQQQQLCDDAGFMAYCTRVAQRLTPVTAGLQPADASSIRPLSASQMRQLLPAWRRAARGEPVAAAWRTDEPRPVCAGAVTGS